MSLGYVIDCLVSDEIDANYYILWENEIKCYIMVGTTIQETLAKGTIVCMLFSLPSVCHCL